MRVHNVRAKSGAGPEVDFCLDPAMLGLEKGTVRLEDKVAEIFEALREPVYHYLVASFRDSADAEEITQEAFFRLYRHLHSGRSVTDARPWIFRVAHNIAVERLTVNKRFTTIDSHSWEEIMDLLSDPGLSPEQNVLQVERYERLHARLGLLSRQQQQCLHLRAEGFRYKEIAEILGIEISSVAEFLRRAIKKLMRENNG